MLLEELHFMHSVDYYIVRLKLRAYRPPPNGRLRHKQFPFTTAHTTAQAAPLSTTEPPTRRWCAGSTQFCDKHVGVVGVFIRCLFIPVGRRSYTHGFPYGVVHAIMIFIFVWRL